MTKEEIRRLYIHHLRNSTSFRTFVTAYPRAEFYDADKEETIFEVVMEVDGVLEALEKL